MLTVKILSDISAIKQVVTHLMVGYTSFELKYSGDGASLTVESEEKIPEAIKSYILKAKQDAKK